MPSPFDTGIRLTITPDPHRVRCDVDEFVLCPSNARADEVERTLIKIADLMACEPEDHADLVEAVRLLVREAEAEARRLRGERHEAQADERRRVVAYLHRTADELEQLADIEEATTVRIAARHIEAGAHEVQS